METITQPRKPRPAANGNKIFLKPASGIGFYVSKAAAARSHFLQTSLAQVPSPSADRIVELEVPHVSTASLAFVMESCERHVKGLEDGKLSTEIEVADHAAVEALELDKLLSAVGASHRLGVLNVLALTAARGAMLHLHVHGCAAPSSIARPAK